MNPRALPAAAVAIFTLTTHVDAHTVGVSRGEYRVSGTIVEAELVLARAEMMTVAPALDRNRDGGLTDDEVTAGEATLAELFVRPLAIHAGSRPCDGTLVRAFLTEEDGFAFRARYQCSSSVQKLSIRAGFLDQLSFGHRHLASIVESGRPPTAMVLFEARPQVEIEIHDDARRTTRAAWVAIALVVPGILWIARRGKRST